MSSELHSYNHSYTLRNRPAQASLSELTLELLCLNPRASLAPAEKPFRIRQHAVSIWPYGRRKDSFTVEIYQMTPPDLQGQVQYAYRVLHRKESGSRASVVLDSLNGAARRVYYPRVLEQEPLIHDLVTGLVPGRSDPDYHNRVNCLTLAQQTFCYEHGDALRTEISRTYGREGDFTE